MQRLCTRGLEVEFLQEVISVRFPEAVHDLNVSSIEDVLFFTASQCQKMILDLSGLPVASSALLATFCSLRKLVEPEKIVICCANEVITTCLLECNFQEVFVIVASLDDALRHFGASPHPV